MNKDQLIGLALLLGSVIGIIVYGYLVYILAQIVLQITVFLLIAGGLAIIAWIGFTLATTPPPQPIGELAKDEPVKEGIGSEAGEEKSK
jgi:predicted DNA-binding transcriptional regulator